MPSGKWSGLKRYVSKDALTLAAADTVLGYTPQLGQAFWLADMVHLSFWMLTCSSKVQMLF